MSRISAAVTHHAPCARTLLRRIRRPSAPNPILLFAFAPSPTTPPDVLSHVTSTLAHLYPEHVGCISAPLPYQYFKHGTRSESCSLAYAFVDGVSFRSTISGPPEVHVGRRHAARERGAEHARRQDSRLRLLSDLPESDGKLDWEHIWNPSAATSVASLSSGHGNGLDSEALPDALRNVDPSAVDNILYFSDKAPEGLAAVLQGAFPRANKLSFISSSTPFITGRPVTLFYNGSILSDGAIGVAFSSPPLSPPPVPELSFPPLVALSCDLSVTCSEGNLILSLDSRNPTQLLLSAVRKHGLSSSHTTWIRKEDEFYVGVIDPPSRQLSQLHRIHAGDPLRGGIALDAPSAPIQGSLVRLYHLPKNAVPDAPAYIPDTIPNSISLFVAPEVTPAASTEHEIADDPAADGDRSIVSSAFLAASENGFTLSRGTQGPWKCIVPGGRVSLSL